MADTSVIESGLASLTSALSKQAGALGVLGTSVSAAKSAYDALSPILKDQFNTWQSLSKTGTGFSNDLIGMSAAAANSRMELKDFAELISKNSENLTGLGGNATRGAEAFAKLSKEMHDSTAVESLRQLGYSNKELNEVLALQMGYVKSSMKMDDVSRQQSIKAAGDLAEEMQLMATLTGKSREEQMENMKKAQSDMAVEAKFRLIGAKEGPEAEKKARELFAKQYNEAQLRGQGQMFKEVFATGQVMSKEAATQAAITGKQSRETMEAARATARGDAEAASAASRRAQEQAMQDNRNTTLLTQATFGAAGGIVTKSIQEQMAAQNSMYHAENAIRQENIEANKKDKNVRLLTNEEILTEAKKRAKEAAQGMDAQGKSVDATSRALVNLGGRAKDLESAMATTAKKVSASGTDLYKSIDKLANKFSAARIGKDGKETSFAQELEKGVEKGVEGKQDLKGKSPKQALAERSAAGGTAGDIGNVIGSTGATLAKLTSMTIDTVANLSIGGVKERNKGTVEMTGQMFEDWGKGTLVALHGTEGVYRPEDIMSLLKGAQGKGAETAIKSLSGLIPKDQKSSAGINIDNIRTMGAGVPTTISSAIQQATAKPTDATPKTDKKETDKVSEETKKETKNSIDEQVKTVKSGNAEILASHKATYEEIAKLSKAVPKISTEKKDKEPPKETKTEVKENKAEPQKVKDAADAAKKSKEEEANKSSEADVAEAKRRLAVIKNQEIAKSRLDEINNQKSALSQLSLGNLGMPFGKELQGKVGGMLGGNFKLPNLGKEFENISNKGFAGGFELPFGRELQGQLKGKNKELLDVFAKTVSPFSSVTKPAKIESPAVSSTKQLQQSVQNIKPRDIETPKTAAKAEQKKATEGKVAEQAQTEKKAPAPGKEATLNDVVTSINQLNTQMNRLIQQQEFSGDRQVKSLRQIASAGNGFFN